MESLMREKVAMVVALGLACHAIYHKLEPRYPPWHLVLLVIVPLLASSLLRPFFSSTPTAALITWFLYLAALTLSTVTYRLSPFHPLAKYPGPLRCRITKIWFASVTLGGKQYIYLQDLHRRYGDVVRIGPNDLSFCTADAIEPMLGSGGLAKAEYWDSHFSDQKTHRSLLGMRDPEAHLSLRRRWAKAFTSEALRPHKSLLSRRVSQLADSLTRRAGTTVDIAKWFSWFSYDVMNDWVFGTGTELMANEDALNMLPLIEDAQPAANFMSHIPWSAEISLWAPSVTKEIHEFRRYSYGRIMKRYHEGSPYKDLFYYLMDEEGSETEKPTFEQVASNASLAIVAGSDTISATLSNIFYFLLGNPIVYERLQAEIDTADPTIEEIFVLSTLPYLNAVINEALRLLPPVLSGSLRSPVVGGGGHRMGSHFLPEGTTALVHTYTLQRDPRNFSPLPDKFLPERWLSSEQQIRLEPNHFADRENIVHNYSAFIPFSSGPANCIGKRMALQEIRVVVCTIIRHFYMRFADGYIPERWEADMCDFFVVKKGTLHVVLTRRAGVSNQGQETGL